MIFSSETPDLHDETPIQANINVLTVPAQGITLEELAVASKEQFKIMVTNFTLLGETFRVVDDSEAHVFEYTYSQGVFPLRGMQLIVVDEDKAYAITATALSATWDKYEAAFDASLRSFRTLADSPSANGTNSTGCGLSGWGRVARSNRHARGCGSPVAGRTRSTLFQFD